MQENGDPFTEKFENEFHQPVGVTFYRPVHIWTSEGWLYLAAILEAVLRNSDHQGFTL